MIVAVVSIRVVAAVAVVAVAVAAAVAAVEEFVLSLCDALYPTLPVHILVVVPLRSAEAFLRCRHLAISSVVV